ncbi:MAG: transaldolase family protein, partial [Dehalococcoidia bacterium]|nr:transaldolase family protein [Dehalococcoidia bacterium]
MRLFLDTANIEQIRHGAQMGILSGVTTNPTLMSKEQGVSYRERVIEICETVKGPVSAECTSRELSELLEEARQIAAWHPNVVVKIPIDEIGLEATSILSREEIKINMTL